MKNKHQNFMIRMRPEVRELLDKAAEDQRRTRVSLLEELIVEAFERRYASSADRLRQMLEQAA